MRVKLSVVIPVYNGADFIDKSYHSILHQSIEDFEILYVDNNSSDDSVLNIKHILEMDSRVRLLHQAKQGAAPARNMGIKAAQGEYIYVFDVDDEIYPEALNSMMQVLDSYPDVSAVFGKMVKSYKGIAQTKKPTDETGGVNIQETPYWGLKWFSNLKTVVGPPAFLYRKTVFETIGLYNESITNNEDTALDIKLGMTQRIAFLDTYVYLYFKHSESTIEQTKREIPRAFMIWPRLVKEHLPFYLENKTPKRFQELLFSQLFQAMGRQLVYTTGISTRVHLKRELYLDLKSISVPFAIRIYLTILSILPLENLRKVYGYYIVPYAVKQLIK
ncbi:glycosyl transferase family 2 [Gelidibacter sediminis]|uniref:Glycosyl transferase family 2 n=1 Tax=Gelidibacter sediminis TaxID=1608710 RepID=A0A4R7PKC4_9FLAO|nr:glycosyltransferase family 2 protein [Gelidibacter sediminis]TDU34412.1 glycosyl transferase family 2 [Gelidibacter sediminis]